MSKTIFDQVVSGEMKSWKVWENEKYLAFLTPFPNTVGTTVVIPKENVGDYIFSLNDDTYIGLMRSTQIVARILEKAFDTTRIAMVFEGTGVAHVHAKLYPLHGELASQTNVWSAQTEFYPEYTGFISTIEGPRMSDQQLDEIQQRIIGVQK